LIFVFVFLPLFQVPRFLEVKTQDVVLIIGCGRVGLTAMCYVRKLAPSATILVADISEARLEIAATLAKADKIEKVYVPPHHILPHLPRRLFSFSDLLFVTGT